MINLDSNWKFLFWLFWIALLFFVTRAIANSYGITEGTGVTIYMSVYAVAALVLFLMWLKFFKDNYLN